jgi:two-component system, OmpR family, sensor kinase
MQAIRSRLPATLRWRLTAWVAGVMVLAAAVVFAVVYTRTGTQLRSQIDRELQGNATQLQQFLRPVADRTPDQVLSVTTRYLHEQPYRANSTLLFVLVPGLGIASNHPEVFSRPTPESGETTSEQARENELAQRLRVPCFGYCTRSIPDVGPVRVLERSVPGQRDALIIGVGQPLQLVESAQHGVAKAFLLAGALALALALAASYLAGARVTAPLRRMAAVAARVDAGELAPRMEVSPNHGSEVQVLAESFNHMLDRLGEAFAGQREFVADASHELRTPLTVIRGQLEVLAAQQPPESEVRRVERLVQAEIARISRLVDDLLMLAQSEQRDFLRVKPIDLRSYVTELWDGISLTAPRRFELGVIPGGELDADPDRLAQALGNLARNAVDHTEPDSGLVRLEVDRTGTDRVRFAVVDDGPGIPSAERERVFERFHRVDPSRSRQAGGAGLGLSIVRAVAEAHGGTVRATAAQNGNGARIELVLPGFEPR